MRYVAATVSLLTTPHTDKTLQSLANGVLVTRSKAMPIGLGLTQKDASKEWRPRSAIKVCVSTALSKKDTEKAGIIIRHAITTVMKGKKWQRQAERGD